MGQKKDALENLGDPKLDDGKTLDWKPQFLEDLHGVILISGDCHDTTNEKKKEIDSIFGPSIKEIITLQGDVRPGILKNHEQ